MAAPAFRVVEDARHTAHFARHLLHRDEIAVHALAHVEPLFLAGVACKGLALFVDGRRDVHIEPGPHPPAQGIVQAIRQGMVERHRVRDRLPRRVRDEIAHAAEKCRRDGQTACVGVVFHVICRRLYQHDPRFDLPDHRAQTTRQLPVVVNVEVVHQRLMKCRAQGLCSPPGFAGAHGDDLFARINRRAHRAVSDIHVMQIISGFPEKQQRAAHHEFDIIRVGGHGKGNRFGHDDFLSSLCALKAPQYAVALF